MNILLEAIRELNKLNEGFEKSHEHFDKHVCQNLNNVEKKFNEVKNSDYPEQLFYIGLNEPEYVNEAKILSNEAFADATKTTTISGVTGFKGKPTEEWKDCFYIIRNPSKFINKKYLVQKYGPAVGNILWSVYVDHAGTDQFVDVCITKGEDAFANTSDKSILTFYPSDINKIERLKNNCLNYYDSRGQINQAKKNQNLIIIPSYYVDNPEYGLRGYVVKPISPHEYKINRGNRGIDNMLAYEKGVYFKGSELIEFLTEDETSRLKDKEGHDYALSSRNPKIAKETFTKAACKSIFKLEGNTTFRQTYINNAVCVWLSSYYEIDSFLQNEPEIKKLIKDRLGIDDLSNYDTFKRKIDSLYQSLKSQWIRLEEGK